MNVLIACEESQRVCEAFRNKGHNAFSCDIIEPSGGHPEWHILGDVLEILNPIAGPLTDILVQEPDGSYNLKYVQSSMLVFRTMNDESHLISKWDLIIAHPPCTYLTCTGNRWYNVEKYGEKAIQRAKDREEAVDFFMAFVNADCDKICIENPVGIMSTRWRKPNQIIQPYQFGDPFEKRTCLWLKGLPNLVPTNVVEPPPRTEFKSGRTMASWYADAISMPKEERAKFRSKTFPGFAAAMAEQWG